MGSLHQSPHSQPIHGRILRLKPLAWPLTPHLWLRFWMTPWSSIRQSSVSIYFNTSTHSPLTYISQWYNQEQMSPFHVWILRSHQDQTTPSTPQYTGNQHTLINTSTGTATISLQPNTVCTKTLAHRAKVVYNSPTELFKELDHLRRA